MKSLLIAICLFLSLAGSSQSRLGFSYDLIYDEFKDKELKVSSTDDGTLYLIFSTEYNQHVYYFDTNKRCDMYVMSPLGQLALNTAVEFYNKNYVIMSTSHWMMYSSGGTCDIHLVRDGKLTYFLWKEL
jgi:hypothetical protein